jgi:hypothetical protein
MTLAEFADQLTVEWETGPYHPSLAEYVLTQLAQPGSNYAGLLEDICRQRWTGAVAI